MKRFGVFIIAVSVVFSTQVFSFPTTEANTNAVKIRFGVKAGGTLSNFWGKDKEDHSDLIPGLVAGISVPIVYTKFFNFEPELLFSMKGTSWEIIDSSYDEQKKATVTRRLYYVDLPLLAKFYLQMGDVVTPFIYLGPTISGLINDPVKDEQSSPGISYPSSNSLYASRIDALASVGCGVHISVGRGYFLLDARYNQGFVPIITGKDLKNWYGTLSIGYVFKFEREKKFW